MAFPRPSTWWAVSAGHTSSWPRGWAGSWSWPPTGCWPSPREGGPGGFTGWPLSPTWASFSSPWAWTRHYKMKEMKMETRATTILAVKRGGGVALAGNGQVTVEDMVLKHTAKKVRTLFKDRVIAGFAGSAADALTLFERFEGQLEKHSGQLKR